MSDSLYEGILDIGTGIWNSSIYGSDPIVPIVPLFRDDLTDLALDASGTFTRASTAYHQQPDGIWMPGLAQELRWKNARRVQNLWTRSDNWNAKSTVYIAGISLSGNGTISFDADSAYHYKGTGVTPAINEVYRIRVKINPGTASGFFSLVAIYSGGAIIPIGRQVILVDTATLPKTISLDFQATEASHILLGVDSRNIYWGNTTTLRGTIEITEIQITRVAATGTDPAAYTEIPITNGTFDTDTVWGKGTGWTISGGTAVATAANGTSLTYGVDFGQQCRFQWTHKYKITFDLVVSGGSVRPFIGASGGTTFNSSGYKEDIITASPATDTLSFFGSSFTGTIDNVRVYEMTGLTGATAPEYVSNGVATGQELVTNGGFDSDTGFVKGTGWTITGGTAVGTATTANLEQQSWTPKAGHIYRIEYDLTVTGGTVKPYIGDTASAVTDSATGHKVHIITATNNTGYLYIDAVTSFTGTIDNLTCKECAHNAGVDGVKYFATANGNTVDANGIVTEATGSALTGPFGLLMEPVTTNRLTYSNDLTNAAWTASNCTVAKNSVGIDGLTNSACTLTATASDATVKRTAAYTAASATHATKWWIKRKTGTGTVELTLDNGSTWQDITSQINGTTYTGIAVDQASLANPQVGIRLRTNTDAVYIGNTLLREAAAKETIATASPIFTTTAEVARAVDALSYTGVPADNETRQVVNAANVDIDDWNGTKATPTVPEVIREIKVYAPGGRPA